MDSSEEQNYFLTEFLSQYIRKYFPSHSKDKRIYIVCVNTALLEFSSDSAVRNILIE